MEIYCFWFFFSEADTEDSQRSTDANTDLSHMKMIFFGNRKKLHISKGHLLRLSILFSHFIIKLNVI